MIVEKTLEEVRKIYPTSIDKVQRCIRLNESTCSIVVDNDVHVLVDWELWDKILIHYNWFALSVVFGSPSHKILQHTEDKIISDFLKNGTVFTISLTQIIAYAIGLPYMIPMICWKTNPTDIEYNLRTNDKIIDNRIINLFVDTDTCLYYTSIEYTSWYSTIKEYSNKLFSDLSKCFKTREEVEKAHDKQIIDAFGWFAEPRHKDTVLPKAPVFYNPDKLPI